MSEFLAENWPLLAGAAVILVAGIAGYSHVNRQNRRHVEAIAKARKARLAAAVHTEMQPIEKPSARNFPTAAAKKIPEPKRVPAHLRPGNRKILDEGTTAVLDSIATPNLGSAGVETMEIVVHKPSAVVPAKPVHPAMRRNQQTARALALVRPETDLERIFGRIRALENEVGKLRDLYQVERRARVVAQDRARELERVVAATRVAPLIDAVRRHGAPLSRTQLAEASGLSIDGHEFAVLVLDAVTDGFLRTHSTEPNGTKTYRLPGHDVDRDSAPHEPWDFDSAIAELDEMADRVGA